MPPAEWRSHDPRSTGGPSAPAAAPLAARVAARLVAARWTEGRLLNSLLRPAQVWVGGERARPLRMPQEGQGITPCPTGHPGHLQCPGGEEPEAIESPWVVLATVLRLGWQPGAGVAVPEPVARHQVCLREWPQP